MPYNPQKDAVVVSKPFGAVGFPIDSRSFFYDEANFVRRAFISIAEVLAYFDTPFKREGMFYVFVNSTGTLQPNGTILGGTRVAYWWKEGTADNQLIVVVEKGDKGDAFTFDDFTPEEIELLQQPAIDAAEIADTATENANIATGLANTATSNANTATTQANTARDSANAATIVANNARGWSPLFVGEADGIDREVWKLDSWINGTGTAPTDNVGLYLKSDGTYTAVKADAANYKGEKGNNGIATPNINAGNLVGRTTAGFGSAEEIAPNGLTLSAGKVYNAIETGSGLSKIVWINNPLGGLYQSPSEVIGAIKIKIPYVTGTPFIMIKGIISSGQSLTSAIDFTIHCYPVSMNTNYDAVIVSGSVKYMVRFFTDGTDRYVTIGEISQNFGFLSVVITGVRVSFHSTAEIPQFASGWEISTVTAFTGTQSAIVSETLPNPSLSNPITGYGGGSGVNTVLTDSTSLMQSLRNLQAQVSARIVNTGSSTNVVLGNGTYQSLATLPAFTATKLLTSRNINGVAFDGTANITVADSTKEPTANKSITLTSPNDIKFPTTKAVSDALALKAPTASPTFTGTVGGITASMVGAPSGSGTSTGTNTGDQTWTTLSGKPTFATVATTGAYADLSGTPSLAGYAPLASPTFTGTIGGITKSMVGLSNVDNTADSAKPVSTAQQTALDLKANLASPTFTGTPSLPTGTTGVTQTAGNNSTKLATTAYVKTAVDAVSSSVTLLKGSTTANNTDVTINRYKDITVTGVAVGDVVNIDDQFRLISTEFPFWISAKVTATNTVRIYFSNLQLSFNAGTTDAYSALGVYTNKPIENPFAMAWTINYTIIK